MAHRDQMQPVARANFAVTTYVVRGDLLIPASRAAVPMRQLVFQQSVRLVGKKSQANEDVVDICQVEFSGHGEARHSTRNRESVRK